MLYSSFGATQELPLSVDRTLQMTGLGAWKHGIQVDCTCRWVVRCQCNIEFSSILLHFQF
jgi:hypothetical protein